MFKLDFSPKEFYVYYRVSTAAQSYNQAHGLDRQTDGCEKFAETVFSIKEHSINYYCDIGSSYNDRNVLTQLNKLIRELVPYSVIMVWDVSRLGRNTIQVFNILRQIKRKNCVVISVSDYVSFGINRSNDKLFYHKIIDAENESDLKSARSKTIASILKSKNIHMGTVPYGYKLSPSKKLIFDTKEQDIIKTLTAKFNEVKSYAQVATFYNKTNMLYRNKFWTARTVRYIITKSNNFVDKTIKSIKSMEV